MTKTERIKRIVLANPKATPEALVAKLRQEGFTCYTNEVDAVIAAMIRRKEFKA